MTQPDFRVFFDKEGKELEENNINELPESEKVEMVEETQIKPLIEEKPKIKIIQKDINIFKDVCENL